MCVHERAGGCGVGCVAVAVAVCTSHVPSHTHVHTHARIQSHINTYIPQIKRTAGVLLPSQLPGGGRGSGPGGVVVGPAGNMGAEGKTVGFYYKDALGERQVKIPESQLATQFAIGSDYPADICKCLPGSVC